MIHFVIVGILVIAMTLLTYFGLQSINFGMPMQASAQAVPVDWMWSWQVAAISFLLALIVVLIFYSLIVFRRKKGDTSDAEHVEGNTPLEIVWTVIPLITVVAYAYMGAYSLGETRRITDPNAMIVKVTAQQFSWTFEYPDGFVTTELHLPVWKQVILHLEAKDVIQSFWVPEFRIKQDAVPGRVTEYRITPNLEGTYTIRCAELCGSDHAYMQAPVIISSQADYDQWVAIQVEQAAAATPEGIGKNLITANGCIGCHSVTPQPGPSAPSWFGLFGAEVKLADGTTVTADEAYLTESILDPAAKEVEGYSPTIMKPQALTSDEIANIIAYIKSLK